MIQETLSDLRHGLRVMARSPGVTVVALLTLAVAIGANSAMFSVIRGVILKPLPYPQPGRIVYLEENNLSKGWSSFSVSPLDFRDWQERNHTMELMGTYQSASSIYTGGEQPEILGIYRVSGNFLEILGARPALGRGIAARDLDQGSDPAVLLTFGFWQRNFGGDANVVGTTMILDGVAHEIVGVLQKGWQPLSGTGVDVIVPLRPEPSWFENRGSHFLYGIGRLKAGVSIDAAREDLSSIAAALEREYPDTNAGWGVVVTPLAARLLGSTPVQLLVFMAAVGLVLLIACANLANMALARSTTRTRELAVRTALGAGRSRIVRQFLAENVLVAGIGGAAGVAMAYPALKAFVAAYPGLLPRMHEIGIDGTVLLFSAGLTIVSGLLFGLIPALDAAGTNFVESLQQGGRGITGDRSRRWVRAALVTGEVGLAVALLVGSGLLVRSYSRLQHVDPGFRTEDRLILSTPLPRAAYSTPESRTSFGRVALERLGAIPGVKSVALTSLVPLGGDDNIWGFWVDPQAPPQSEADGSALFYRVSPGYFRTMGIPLIAGRGITDRDRADAPPVVVVSQSIAETFYPDRDPVGQSIRFGLDDDEPPVEIVGVVGDVEHYTLGRRSTPQVYVPFVQRPTGNVNFVVATTVPPTSLANAARDVVRSLDPDLPIMWMGDAGSLIASAVALPRFRMLVMAGFGLTALLLAMIGLYGVMAFMVSQRTREIAVRIALGARRRSVVTAILREGLPLIAIGLALGCVLAFALSRILESMLFEISARDPAVFVGAPAIVMAVALGALIIPMNRAVRVDPARTLAE